MGWVRLGGQERKRLAVNKGATFFSLPFDSRLFVAVHIVDIAGDTKALIFVVESLCISYS